MRLASALETTPNEFLIGTNSSDNAEWEDIADMLRYFDKEKFSDMAFRTGIIIILFIFHITNPNS